MTDPTPTPAPPLSVAAQMVLNAFVDSALPPFHVIAKPMAAATIRALVEQTLPAEKPICGGMRPGGTQPVTSDEFKQIQRQRTRIRQLAIAAELDGEAGQHTETNNV